MTTKATTSVRPWKKIWKLLSPFWRSEEKWPARLLLFSVVVLALGLVYLNVLFNDWNRDFYNALETKDLPQFWDQLWRACKLFCVNTDGSVIGDRGAGHQIQS